MKTSHVTALLGIAFITGCSVRDTTQAEAQPAETQDASDNLLSEFGEGSEHGNLRKICDEGRAVYVYTGYKAGGVAVVPDASECAKTPAPVQEARP